MSANERRLPRICGSGPREYREARAAGWCGPWANSDHAGRGSDGLRGGGGGGGAGGARQGREVKTERWDGGGGVTRIAMLAIGTVGFAQGEGGFSKLVSQPRWWGRERGTRLGEGASGTRRGGSGFGARRGREPHRCARVEVQGRGCV